MNCTDARRHWHLYHDSEGEAELQFRLDQHLSECPQCAEWFAEQSWFVRRLAEGLRNTAHDERMWGRILAGAGVAPRRRLVRWPLFAVAAAAVLAIAVFLPFERASSGTLAPVAVAAHTAIETGRQAPEFVSESDEEIERYFKRRVPFPVHCPPRKDSGFQVSGGGACQLGGRPAAFLAGRVGPAPVSVFVLPDESLSAFPHDRNALVARGVRAPMRHGGYELVAGLVDRNVVLVVGKTDADRLRRVLNAYGSYHEEHRL